MYSLRTAAIIPRAMEPQPETTTMSSGLIRPSLAACMEQARGSVNAAWWGRTDFDIYNNDSTVHNDTVLDNLYMYNTVGNL